MHELPAGPGSDRLRLFMTGQMDRHRAEVMSWAPVFGLVRPVLEGVLGASNGESVTLAYGDPLELSGPFVQVRTFFPPDHAGGDWSARDQDVGWLLAAEHRRLAQHAGVEDRSGQPPQRSVASLPTGDGQVTATVLSDGAVLVARLQPARSAEPGRRVQVSVVARGVRLDALGIGQVEDLQPFWDRRGPWLTRLAAAHEAAAAELAVLAVPSGLDALRALVDSSIGQADHLRQEQDGPPSLGPGRRDMLLQRRLWDAATEAQGHLRGQPLEVASRAVTSMVNHLTTASLQLSWFADPGLRAKAINETIGYVVFDANVASTAAQAAWQERWNSRSISPAEQLDRVERTERGEPITDPDAVPERRGQLEHQERVWRQAWSAWAHAEAGTPDS